MEPDLFNRWYITAICEVTQFRILFGVRYNHPNLRYEDLETIILILFGSHTEPGNAQ